MRAYLAHTADHLERQPDPGDGRARIVRLTPTGRQMARRAGQYKGLKGNFVRTDGRITGINFTGRLAVKQ